MKNMLRMHILTVLLPLAILLAGCGNPDGGAETDLSGGAQTTAAVSEAGTASPAADETKTDAASASMTDQEEESGYAVTEHAPAATADRKPAAGESTETRNASAGQTEMAEDRNPADFGTEKEIDAAVRNWMDALKDARERNDAEAMAALFDPFYSMDDVYLSAETLAQLDDEYAVEAREVEEGIIVCLHGTYKESGEEAQAYMSFSSVDGSLLFDYRIINQHICSNCGGTGQICRGGQPCGICGGTGTVWVDNVYFDGIQWQGEMQACGGCGGAGYTGGTFEICGLCGGSGLNW